ncbi:hypothetical protein [Streptococcus suis]|uniref:hypothetical protein n=1 Tax=Streptococcus suis TaxID=1307 RepID=UPI000CF46EE9
MFLVTNLNTKREWQADSRDELLYQLDVENTRLRREDSYGIKVQHLNEETGEILEETFLTLPLDTTVDELLTGFGRKGKKKKRVLPFFGLFRRKPKKKQEEEEKPSFPNLGSRQEQESELELASVDSILEETATEAQSEETEEAYTEEATAEVEELEEVVAEEEVVQPSEEVEQSEIDEDIQDVSVPAHTHDQSPTSTSPSFMTFRKKETNVERYEMPPTPTSLQEKFSLELEQEILEIDEEMRSLHKHLAQLAHDRENHLKLYQTIQNVALPHPKE